MKQLVVAAAVLGVFATVRAQERQPESAVTLAERIRNGGWFETSRWRRGADGALEMHFFADMGAEATEDRFVPLLSQNGEAIDYSNIGLIGNLALFCHGSGDLLGMTDAAFHLQALGIGTTDVELRQYLAVPPPSFEGERGRAELLDRLLVVDLLVRRGCTSAVAELDVLVANEKLPAPLRLRARRALASLRGGTTGPNRQRLDGKTLRLPAAFDGCVIVDHARLPDLSWLTALGRRTGALVTISAIEMAGGEISAAVSNGAQRMCDLVSELPFGVAHRFGNARLDHSCVVVSAKANAKMPVAITWEAVGEFEHERWQAAKMSEAAAADNPLFGGTLAVEVDHLFATTDGSSGMPRPAMVEKMGLLLDTGQAIRAIVPANSKLLLAMAPLKLPAAQGAELRVTFDDPGLIVLVVEGRDEEAAEAWMTKGKELLAQLRTTVDADLPEPLQQCKELKELLDALFAASFSTKGDAAFAVIEVKGFTPAKVKAITEALVGTFM